MTVQRARAHAHARAHARADARARAHARALALALARALTLALALTLAPAHAADPRPATTWALIIGVGDLADRTLDPTPRAPADAERLRDHLTTIGRVPSSNVVLLADAGAPFFDPSSPTHALPTRRNVRLALAWLQTQARAGDLALISWAGQGATGPAGEPLLVTSDAARADLAGTAVEARWLATTLGALPSNNALILDTSFAGRTIAWTGPRAAPKTLADLVPGPRGTLWAAAPPDAIALEAVGAPHGAFTHALLAALREGRGADDAWDHLTRALPATAPRPVRLGRGDLGLLFPTTARRERPELVLQTPHAGGVAHAAFDPTGRRVATTGDDGTLKLWSVTTHRIIANLDTPGLGAIIAWSPDGERLLAEGSDGVTVWSATGARLWSVLIGGAFWKERIEVIQLTFASIARFSPDGALVAIVHPDRPIEIRRAADGEVVATLAEASTGPIAWDGSGKRFAYTAADGRSVRVVKQTAWKKPEATLRGAFACGTLYFTPDGKTLVVGHTLEEHPGDFPPQTLAFYDSGRRFAARKPPAPLSTTLPPAMSADGRFFAVTDRGRVSIVSVDTLGSIDVEGEAGGALQLSADGKTLAVYMADDTRLYDTATGKHVRTIPGEAIALSRDLTAALSGSRSNWGDGLAFRDLTGKLEPVPLEAKARPIIALALDGKHLVVAEPDALIRWDLATGRPTGGAVSPDVVKQLDIADALAYVRTPQTSPDGKRRVSLDDAGILTIADLGTGAVTRQSTGMARAGRLVFVDDRLVAIGPELLYPDRFCSSLKVAPPKWRCLHWAAAPPPGMFSVVLWDLARGARHAILEGHRAAVIGFVAIGAKTIVTASLDTTMRVWDATTAAHLATIAPMNGVASQGADGSVNDWVVTTPDGLFDGSLAAQAHMQWRVGDTLFRLEQFAGELYTPGLFAKLAAGERPRAKTGLDDMKPPPRVKIASPGRGADLADGVVKVVVRVEDLGGGSSPAWLYVNGHRVPATRARPLTVDKTNEPGVATVFEVELAEGQNHLRATAFNSDGTVEAGGDEVVVTWSVPEAERPVLHLVAIGIDVYQEPALRLSFAVADARAIAAAFTPGLFAKVETQLLLDDKATRAGIKTALAAVAAKAKPRDAVLVYLAGHGTLVGSTFYYLPVEAKTATDDDVVKTGFSQSELAEALMQIPATKQIVVLDACHSGAGAKALGRLMGDRDAVGLARAQRRLAKASGVFLVAAATAEQKAGEIAELGHGILTYAILAGIGSKNAPPAARTTPDGQVTVNALLAWLDEEVPRLTTKHHGGPQNPVQASTGQDFPIARVPIVPPAQP